MNKIVYCIAACFIAVMASCSDADYLNAIPAESKLLMRLDPSKISGTGNRLLLKTMLQASDLKETGLDLSADIYVFEDGLSNIGLCARVSDRSNLEQMLGRRGRKLSSVKGNTFFALSNNWIAGCSDKAALMMGPVLPDEQQAMVKTISGYLMENEEAGVASTPLFAKLDSIESPMSLVCEADALPQQLVAPLTLGAPKDCELSDIMIAAEMRLEDHCLVVKGETFSLKSKVNTGLRHAREMYRPITGRYMATMTDTDAFGLFMNVEGKSLIASLRRNKTMRTMLAGINTAIDMDNIMKSIDGDMALISPSPGATGLQMMMGAQVEHANWLADVDYWKQSVPPGGHIGDWGRNCYYYTSGSSSYYFGVTSDGQYMSGNSREEALRSVKAAPNPISPFLQDIIKGGRLVMVVNPSVLEKGKALMLSSMLSPFFRQVRTIVFTMKDDSVRHD